MLFYSTLHRIRSGLEAEGRVSEKHNKASTSYCSALGSIRGDCHISKMPYLVIFMLYEKTCPVSVSALLYEVKS